MLVGREREMAALQAHLAAAEAGHGGVVLLGGEPGVGKTRLLDELATRARPHGVAVLWGRCWEEGGAPPYWPWMQALRAQLRHDDAARLRAELGAQAATLATLVPELSTGDTLPALTSLDPEHKRFALFDAVAAGIRVLAGRGPLLFLLDDVHAADRPSLRLLAFLGRELHAAPVLIVCAHRDAEVRAAPALAEALAQAAREGEALSVSGLSQTEVARFVEVRGGVRAPAPVVSALHRQTGGNPFFLDEVIRLLAAEGRLTASAVPASGRLPVPGRIHDTIERRLAPLPPPCRRLLDVAAVIGHECGVRRLAALVGAAPTDVLATLDAAETAGIVTIRDDSGGRLHFRHALCREVVYRSLGDARRAALHGEVAHALEHQMDAPLAELAHHALEAAEGGADVERAVEHARRAAAEATVRLAYEDAAALYERALQALALRAPTDPAVRAELLADLGEARQRTGDGDAARRAFEDVLAIARRLDPARRGPLLARAAQGLAGAGPEVGHVDLTVVAVLDEALDALDPGDGAQRARLLSRLAAELAYARDDTRRHALSERAVAMAERLGDPATLADVLARRHIVLMEPGNAAERRALASSIIDLARRSGDREMAADGHGWRLFAHLELADLTGVERDLDALARLANETRHPHYVWLTAMFRGMRALLAGRFDDGDRLAHEALALGQRYGNTNTLVAYGSQLYVLRWGQGRLAEIEPLLQGFAAEHSSAPVWESATAHLHAMVGNHDEARARFEAACDTFLGLPRDVTWLLHLGLLGETCWVLGDRARAAVLLALLTPFAGQMLVAGPGAACFGAAARVAGALAATLGRFDDALAHLEGAMQLNERMGALAWVADTAAVQAAVLLSRAAPGDRDAARERLARAHVLAGRLDLRPVLGATAALERRLGDDVAPLPATERQVIRREGDHWTVEFGGRACRLFDSKGIRLLAELLRRPGEELHVATLVAAAEGSEPPVDLAAVHFAESERHRVSVTRAIHALLDRIAEVHPALEEHLARTLRTGTRCAYEPDPRVPTEWTS